MNDGVRHIGPLWHGEHEKSEEDVLGFRFWRDKIHF